MQVYYHDVLWFSLPKKLTTFKHHYDMNYNVCYFQIKPVIRCLSNDIYSSTTANIFLDVYRLNLQIRFALVQSFKVHSDRHLNFIWAKLLHVAICFNILVRSALFLHKTKSIYKMWHLHIGLVKVAIFTRPCSQFYIF